MARALCGMFNEAIRAHSTPKCLRSDDDQLYRFHQCQANLRVLCVTELKRVPYVAMSHPFVERLIGMLRRECLDRMLFWSAPDLKRKLFECQHLLQFASGACVFERTDASPDTEGCRNAQPLPMGGALPRSLSDADRRVTSEQRRRWLARRLASGPSPSRGRHRETDERCFSSTSYARHS